VKPKRNDLSPREAKRQRAALTKSLARDERQRASARLQGLKAGVRKAHGAARGEVGRVRRACRAARADARARARGLREQLAGEMRDRVAAERASARTSCDSDLEAARALRSAEARARAELQAEQDYQRNMRTIVAGQRAKARTRPRGIASVTESDNEVESNLPADLVPLWRRVKRGIKGTDRKTRTEAFLEYAESNESEAVAALVDDADALTDRAIAEMERRQAMGNPKKKKAKKKAKPAKAAPKKKPAAATRKAPRRPWWDTTIEQLAARGDGSTSSKARAVVGAEWWAMGETHRRAVVARLARSRKPADRIAAFALAKLERRRHGGKPQRNPPKEVVSIVYREQKDGDSRPMDYEHDFRGKRPKLRERRGRLQFEGGSYRMEDGWIHG